MKYVRLLLAVFRGIRRSYVVWQMNEVARTNNGVVHSCTACGMALREPCEHELGMGSKDADLFQESTEKE